MAQFEVRWTVEQWYSVTIEANDEAEARQKWHNGEFGNPVLYGTEVQDNIDVFPGVTFGEANK